MCMDMCVDMCMDMRIDMCVDMCMDMRIDMCVDVCIDMCVSMCLSSTPVRSGLFPAHSTVRTHTYGRSTPSRLVAVAPTIPAVPLPMDAC